VVQTIFESEKVFGSCDDDTDVSPETFKRWFRLTPRLQLHLAELALRHAKMRQEDTSPTAAEWDRGLPEGDVDHTDEDRQAYESEKLDRPKPSEY
jgi:hypothetical protein